MIASLDLYDILGLSGAALFLVAYGGLQLNRLDPHKPRYLLMNLVGAILVLISLIHDFNLAAFALEAAWGVIAILGLIRYALARRG